MAFSYGYTLFIFNILFFSISLGSSNVNFSDDSFESITETRMEKTTHLHFYMQDWVSGKNRTAVQMIGKGFGFGATFMMDDALTERRDRDSKIIGRAQGTYSWAAQNDIALLMVVTFALAHAVWVDKKTGDACVEYNVFVKHF